MKDSQGFTGGFTQIKNLTEEQIDKIVPIQQNSWNMFLDLMFNVKQNRGVKNGKTK